MGFLRSERRVHDNSVSEPETPGKCCIPDIGNNEINMSIEQPSVCFRPLDRFWITIDTSHTIRPKQGSTDCEHTRTAPEIAYRFSFNIAFHECMVQQPGSKGSRGLVLFERSTRVGIT